MWTPGRVRAATSQEKARQGGWGHQRGGEVRLGLCATGRLRGVRRDHDPELPSLEGVEAGRAGRCHMTGVEVPWKAEVGLRAGLPVEGRGVTGVPRRAWRSGGEDEPLWDI